MLLQRGCLCTPSGKLPPPAPLPSLRDALTRRALLFGAIEADAAPVAPLGPWQALADVVGRVVDLLLPRGTR